ncbi:MAG: hypothetical protein BWY75_02015 [bacterium ADurb.Bin425]|nr:MAG: hypothetical protein BWY75_02015 [bacterium ADurb.Bin425]
MGLQDKKPDGIRFILVQEVFDCFEITKRLSHFFLADLNKAVMQPIASQWVFMQSFRLGDFVFVVRKDQVFAA